MDLVELHETDYNQWLVEISKSIHELGFKDLDILAADLLEMAGSDERAVRSQLRRFLHHHLKWKYQPEKRTRSWSNTISNAQRKLFDITDRSASLRNHANQNITQVYPQAVDRAVVDTNKDVKDFPAEPEFKNLDQILKWRSDK